MQYNVYPKTPDFSMNILRMGNKSAIQRGFFTNSAGNLLPALEFLSELYNFCNFEILFSLMEVTMTCRSSDIFYKFGNDQILTKIEAEIVYEN